MSVRYQHTVIDGRILVWWTDHDGRLHQHWLEGEAAGNVTAAMHSAERAIQSALRQAVA